jgi:GT2 family glycosyltransferase
LGAVSFDRRSRAQNRLPGEVRKLMETTSRRCAVTVVIPTFRRTDSLENVISRIIQCDPAPAEVIVHVDFGDVQTAARMQTHHPAVRVLNADRTMGPGGSRNRLIREATFECVVSLDDDSWPERSDFFSCAVQALENHPNAAVLACAIRERDEVALSGDPLSRQGRQSTKSIASFVGCGAVIRRSAFLKTDGYLPLRYAYGMEELDVSLQLLDLAYEITYCEDLKVYHDCERSRHHADRRINAAQIRNTALLAFLRYPFGQLPLGILQTANRVAFSIRQRRWAGIIGGILSIPAMLWKYRNHRRPVTAQTLHHFRGLRKACQTKVAGG